MCLKQTTEDGYSFQCCSIHQFGKRNYSFFFKGSYYDYAIRDLSVFRKHYLDGHALPQSASSAEMESNHTSVNLGSHVWEIFCEFVYSTYWTGMSKSMKACSVGKLNTIGVILPQPVYGYLQWYNAVLTR